VAPASVSDWAVTGSTPAEWDPTVNGFGLLLGRLNQQYVVMTLGANPLLSAFTDIKVDEISVADGPCVSSTGYQEWWFGEWYAGPLSKPIECLEKEWEQQNSAQHLARIYSRLLAQGDRVIVLGYYRGCPWSFGNWQVEGTIAGGPASGKDCKSQTRPIGPQEPKRISQWEQAVAVSSRLNSLIAATVKAAKVKARKRRPNAALASNIVFAVPNLSEWEKHQPGSSGGSWIFLNDTWIHPSKAGHANLAETVAKAMCSAYGHWCGPPEWKW
jgi:hypothetical protein